MAALAREGRGESQRLAGRRLAVDLDSIERERRIGQRAGLVEDDVRRFGEPLYRIGFHDEDAACREHGERPRDRDRHRERERAGAGDDEHGERGGERPPRIEEAPRAGRQRRQQQHADHEARRRALAGLRELRPGRLRAADEGRDPGEHGVVTDADDA